VRILIAFILSFGIGAASRWTGVPSLAPQAIIGALLIVAMSTGWVTVDRVMAKKQPAAAALLGKVDTGVREGTAISDAKGALVSPSRRLAAEVARPGDDHRRPALYQPAASRN
jgi:XapX domain-containing protein